MSITIYHYSDAFSYNSSFIFLAQVNCINIITNFVHRLFDGSESEVSMVVLELALNLVNFRGLYEPAPKQKSGHKMHRHQYAFETHYETPNMQVEKELL